MCEECKAFEDAIINKHLYCIIRLKEEGTNYDKNLGYCSMAAFSGDFEILKYLIDNFDNDPLEPVCNYSVIGGSLCCLVTAYSGGFFQARLAPLLFRLVPSSFLQTVLRYWYKL